VVFILLRIYQKECHSGYSKGICTPMLTAVLFTISKLWKQARCPTTNKWIKKIVVFTQNGILLSHKEE
jgi:hypothetical protein